MPGEMSAKKKMIRFAASPEEMLEALSQKQRI
jgi:hypothetical protein